MVPFDPASDLKDSLQRAAACDRHPAVAPSRSPADAAEWWETVQGCSPAARREHLRWLGRNDLFFLAVYILNRKHFIPNERTANWTFARCREVQEDPDGYVDLWPRFSFKSEIITFAKTIQDVLIDPERTFGIFSHSRPIAASFVIIIKREFEGNELLKDLYSDVLWSDPKSDCLEHSLSWTVHAITVKRRGNPKEATIEAWGLTDGQPVSRRFSDMVYDDVITPDFTSELMIVQTTTALERSFLLTASDPPRYRYIATYQEIGDTTQQVIDRNLFKLRHHGPLDDNGNVAYCSDEKFADIRKKLSTKVFALQVLLDPSKSKDEHDIGFKEEWLEYYDEPPRRRMVNVYGLVDPAGDSPDSNSQFALWIIGLGVDRKRRILDAILDKLDLEDRWEALRSMQEKWECLKWGYEKYGFQADIEHFRYRQRQINYLFTIVPLGGIRRSKDSRIGELLPAFKNHDIIFPKTLTYRQKNGREIDIIKYFREREYLLWPYNPKQRDLLDALARTEDKELGMVYPRGWGRSYNEGGYSSGESGDSRGSYMSE